MLRKIVFILFLACSTVQGYNAPKGLKLRIQNGYNSREGEVPYVVQLEGKKGPANYTCTGAIINKDFVLTAAHCIYESNIKDDVNQLYIKVITGAQLTRPVSIHSVKWIRKHENFSRPDTYLHDIALLKVSPPFKFNGLVAPARLPPNGFEVPPGTEALFAGWGRTTTQKLSTDDKSIPKILQKLTLPISSENYCKEKYFPTLKSIYSAQICTVIPSGLIRSPCKGDSGGALTINKNIIVGIASTSPQSDVSCSKYPTVYTKVSKYIGWINENMKAINDNDIPSRLITDKCSENRDCLIFS